MTSDATNLKIASFNMNGAGRYEKQKDVFDFLRKKKFDIIMLQETHWKTESENYVRSLWGYNCIVCGTSTAKNGVAFLLNNTFDYKIHNIVRDQLNGTFLILDITIFDMRYTLTNVYGPSDRDNPEFFIKLFQEIEAIGNQEIITGGDWNVLLDPSVDARNYLSYRSKPNSRNTIKQISSQLDLVDIFRKVYPSKRAYTWRKFNSIKQSRLDFFLISDSLVTDVNFVDITPGYRSDHSIICLYVNTNKKNEGRKTYWKFNNSLLKDKSYIELTKKVISEVIKQYAIPVYNPENINLVDKNDITFSINDQLFFETLLMEIRGSTIVYSSSKKRREEKEESDIVRKIENLESLQNLSHIDMLELENMKLRLQELREHKLKGLMMRSKLQWLQHGEKPSNYFCRLEKRNFTSKRMCFLEKDDSSIIYDQDEILQETKNFYEDLYSFRDTDDINLDNIIQQPTKLNDNEKASIEGPITFEEAVYALKEMKNNKSPGNSGFSIEFFKFFFKDIGHFLIRSINLGFDQGKLSITQRQGVITCIPKEGKNLQHLKNWRPISLLNVSYKIASNCITNRIKLVLPKIINSTQKAFLKGRNISDNIKLMYDVLLYTESENIPGLLLLVDFQKAFDSISWEFVDRTLRFFNFGDDIRRWVKVFYNDIVSCVQINGKYSEYFAINRGVRQGDALSAYLFLLCGEVMSKMLYENDIIKGIKIKDEEAFLSQFADDTALFLDGSKESFEQCIQILSTFAKLSGLTINFEKTVVVWLGAKKNSRDRYLRDMNFTWDPGGEIDSKFKYLGIYFSTNTKKISNLNYANKLSEIEKLLKVWSKRFLTPYGKVTVIKTLALSKLTYLFTNIPDPSNEFLKNVQSLFTKFLWNYKPSKISFVQVCQSYDEGGMNMINIYDYLTYIKVSCFKRYIRNDDTFKLMCSMYPKMKNLHLFGFERLVSVMNSINNPMLYDVLKHVKNFFEKIKIENMEDVLYEPLFCNKHICIANKPIYLQSWIDENVTKICHMFNGNSDFLSFREFIVKYPNVVTNFLQYNGIISSIRAYFRKENIIINAESVDILADQESVCWQYLKKDKNELKTIIRTKTKFDHSSKQKWNDKFDNLNWKYIFRICHKTTTDTKIKWFQYRLLYRTLPTNRFLSLRKIKNTSLCDFCNSHEETIPHMFWDCQHVQTFWNELYNALLSKIPHLHNLRLNEQLILFGWKEHCRTDRPFDLILLAAKYHIYLCKFSQTLPNVNLFMKQLKLRYKLELYYNENIQNENFNQIWRNYEGLILTNTV